MTSIKKPFIAKISALMDEKQAGDAADEKIKSPAEVTPTN